MHPIIRQIEKMQIKKNPGQFEIGDSVDVHNKIREGDKERTQIFKGVVIKKRGGGINTYFTVRKIVQGEGVERTFPLNSPKIVNIVVTRRGNVRRAKLYYLRDRVGKATKVKEKLGKKNSVEQALLETGMPSAEVNTAPEAAKPESKA